MGALNANVFATSRLCVAASKRSYFPKILANLHVQSGDREVDYYEKKLRNTSSVIKGTVIKFATSTARLRFVDGVPMCVDCIFLSTGTRTSDSSYSYAMMLNACLASFYIVIGTFNDLVTFVGKHISQRSAWSLGPG
jgi:solute carrier family 7 (L-type amino acid transporter), member 6